MSDEFTSRREVTLRFMAAPTDQNKFGSVHGGSVMKWIDEAGYICSAGWCGCDAVTVYVGGIQFLRPIHVGDLVEVHARLIYTGTTSMHISVDVRAGDPRLNRLEATTHCIIIFVGLGQDGKPSAVPKWVPQTDEDRALEAYAVRLMELRKGIEETLKDEIG
jgi:acyl-CoA hydrolase